jgi:hypothetical protein
MCNRDLEQSINIKCLTKSNKTITKTVVYGDETISCALCLNDTDDFWMVENTCTVIQNLIHPKSQKLIKTLKMFEIWYTVINAK